MPFEQDRLVITAAMHIEMNARLHQNILILPNGSIRSEKMPTSKEPRSSPSWVTIALLLLAILLMIWLLVYNFVN
jgi:hypothetical protein